MIDELIRLAGSVAKITPAAPAASVIDAVARTGANIMAVDDQPANLKLLEELLGREGYTVRSFPRGRLALAAVEQAPQLAQAMETIIASYPAADTIHMVMDNLNIHGPRTLTDYLGKDKGKQLWSRLTVHYTPKHGSWLNQAEIEIGLFARQCLARRIPALAMRQRESVAWNSKVSHERIEINRHFTRKKARVKFGYKRPKKNCFMRSKT